MGEQDTIGSLYVAMYKMAERKYAEFLRECNGNPDGADILNFARRLAGDENRVHRAIGTICKALDE